MEVGFNSYVAVIVAIAVVVIWAVARIWRNSRRNRRATLQQDWYDLTNLTPATVDEALDAMRQALVFFHKTSDHRAIFLRAYYIITRNVRRAIRVQEAGGKATFFDPNWVSLLSGKFATLYFLSLPINQQTRSDVEAWVAAHGEGARTARPVSLELLLGINAHINFDLPVALFQMLRVDDKQFVTLMRRKFDHDQVNGILLASLPEIQDVLSKEYGGAMRLLRRLMFTYDRAMVGAGLSYYRERVWWHATSFLAAEDESEIHILRNRLTWEATAVAKRLVDSDSVWARLYLSLEALTRRHTLKVLSQDQLDLAVRVGGDPS